MIPPLADISFDKIDPQVVFVLVVVVFSAIRAIWENIKKNRAERELAEDLARRAEERSATLEPAEYEPPLDEVYEQYRREIHERQTRSAEEEAQFENPEPTPPPVPGAAPAPPPLPVEAPAAPFSPADWAPPAAPPAPEARLTPEEQAALAALQARETSQRKRHPSRSGLPARRLLASPSNLRTAVVLREILGPPKALAEDPFA